MEGLFKLSQGGEGEHRLTSEGVQRWMEGSVEVASEDQIMGPKRQYSFEEHVHKDNLVSVGEIKIDKVKQFLIYLNF